MNDEKFEKGIEHFKQEISGLRTGRASSGLVENILVESYGAKTPLMHLASVSIPDARSIAIQPWDKSNLGPIEKAIQISNIGLNPVNDGILIRLSIPQMTEERRKEMVKQLGQMMEQAKIAVRNVREEILKDLKKQQEENNLTDDDFEGQKKDLQEIVDKYNEKIKDIAAVKEKEVMTI
jgi:ribosome recycling factor